MNTEAEVELVVHSTAHKQGREGQVDGAAVAGAERTQGVTSVTRGGCRAAARCGGNPFGRVPVPGVVCAHGRMGAKGCSLRAGMCGGKLAFGLYTDWASGPTGKITGKPPATDTGKTSGKPKARCARLVEQRRLRCYCVCCFAIRSCLGFTVCFWG